jgi:hypothetical protein
MDTSWLGAQVQLPGNESTGQQLRLSTPAPLMVGLEPIPPFLGIGALHLFGIEDHDTNAAREIVHPGTQSKLSASCPRRGASRAST